MTTILIGLLVVALLLDAEALRERRQGRHGVERRMVTYAGQLDARVSARLAAIRRGSEAARRDRLARRVTPAAGLRPADRLAMTVRA